MYKHYLRQIVGVGVMVLMGVVLLAAIPVGLLVAPVLLFVGWIMKLYFQK